MSLHLDPDPKNVRQIKNLFVMRCEVDNWWLEQTKLWILFFLPEPLIYILKNGRPYKVIYFHISFTFILVWRLLLNKFFTYGDDYRLHIYTDVWKQFNSRVIKADNSVWLVYVLIILQFIFGFFFFSFCVSPLLFTSYYLKPHWILL